MDAVLKILSAGFNADLINFNAGFMQNIYITACRLQTLWANIILCIMYHEVEFVHNFYAACALSERMKQKENMQYFLFWS